MTAMQLRRMNLKALNLARGGHPAGDVMCVMEAVAFMAREPWSDNPDCCGPTISLFMRNWNDSLGDEDRQKLKPYIKRLINTNHGPAISLVRSYMVFDWLVRVQAPAWLDLAGLETEATHLRELSELRDKLTVEAANGPCEAARSKASAARDAARAAARAAAYAAARAAAGEKLNPTVKTLQASAFDLLDRMIAVKPEVK